MARGMLQRYDDDNEQTQHRSTTAAPPSNQGESTTMRATNLTDTKWYDGSAPKGERRKPRPTLKDVFLENTIIGAEDMATAQRSLGNRNARIYTRTIKAGGAEVTVYVVVSRAKGVKS